ncbi:MAG: MFS transporter [Planctomycetes bacterium]|nr:MFS transporter [Planctomycetota bacterium]
MDPLHVRSLPFLSRRNYYYEFKQLVPWSILAGLVEGQFASVVVSKTFHGSELQIAIASATPLASMLSSLIWGMLCIGRPKIRLATLFTAGTALCAGLVGAIPATRSGAIWFICQMAAAQVVLAGVVTVRSAFWKSNYPREVRGQIAARLQGVRFVVSVVTVLAAAAICDRNPGSYRFIYPVAAVFGIAGIGMLRRIHIRGERSELGRHQGSSPDEGVRPGYIEPYAVTALLSPGHVLGQMYRVLHDDRRFLRYCMAQLLIGVGNLITISIIVLVVTRDLQLGDRWGFWISTVLIMALPRLVMLGSFRRWGELFDRVGVVQFRVVNVWWWILTLALGMAATVTVVTPGPFGASRFLAAVGLFALRAFTQGLGYGGGALAWNLGHLHFARPEQAEVYMGIHVSLTGLRALVAPIGGMWLWQAFQAWGWPAWLVWAPALALSFGSLATFTSLAREEKRLEESASKV